MLVRQLIFVALFIVDVVGIVVLLIPKSIETQVVPPIKSSAALDLKNPEKKSPEFPFNEKREKARAEKKLRKLRINQRNLKTTLKIKKMTINLKIEQPV